MDSVGLDRSGVLRTTRHCLGRGMAHNHGDQAFTCVDTGKGNLCVNMIVWWRDVATSDLHDVGTSEGDHPSIAVRGATHGG